MFDRSLESMKTSKTGGDIEREKAEFEVLQVLNGAAVSMNDCVLPYVYSFDIKNTEIFITIFTCFTCRKRTVKKIADLKRNSSLGKKI